MLNIQAHVNFDDLLKLVEQLTEEQKRILREQLAEKAADTAEIQLKPRTPNLHPGSVWMSDDFDDPLPDEFWFGEDS